MSRAAGEWFTAAEFAGFELPSIPATESGLLRRALRESWLKRPREGRGGGYEFHISNLPVAQRVIVAERIAPRDAINAGDPANSNALAPISSSHGMKSPAPATTDREPLSQTSIGAMPDWQRHRMEARLALLEEIERLTALSTKDAAIASIIERAAKGMLPPGLQRLVPIANARAGGSGRRTLSRPTIFRWFADKQKGIGALAPREPARRAEPDWVATLMRIRRRPQKQSLAAVHALLAQSLPAGIAVPSLHQVKRYVGALSAIERNAGRMGPKELKALKPYVKRTTDLQDPLSVVSADGHTADFKVEHPDSGAPLRPEITSIIDTKTRRVIGWSASLKENSLTVLDALRNAIERNGVPAIFYTDNGPGYCNELLDAPAIGMFARLGITHETSIPYNSQARGKIERLHQSLWIRGARELGAYIGRDLDREHAKAVENSIATDIKQRGAARLLMPWRDFIAWGERLIELYNARPHRGLPKIVGADGRRRHMTPDEAWALAETGGWRARRLDEIEAQLLWHPQIERKCLRGLVRLWNGEYFNRELAHYHDRIVQVGYDIHDASCVWVSDMDGRFICIAQLDGHARPEFPVDRIERAESRADQLHRERQQRRVALKQKQIAEIRAEGKLPAPALPPPAELSADEIEAADRQLSLLAPDEVQADDSGQCFTCDSDKVAWMRAHPGEVSDSDRTWFTENAARESWRDFNEITEEDLTAFARAP